MHLRVYLESHDCVGGRVGMRTNSAFWILEQCQFSVTEWLYVLGEDKEKSKPYPSLNNDDIVGDSDNKYQAECFGQRVTGNPDSTRLKQYTKFLSFIPG